MTPTPHLSTKLLAETYQVMSHENALTINDALAAQLMAVANSVIQKSNDPSIDPPDHLSCK